MRTLTSALALLALLPALVLPASASTARSLLSEGGPTLVSGPHEDPPHSVLAADQPRGPARPDLGGSQVHTYFVAGSQTQPGVLVHNLSVERLARAAARVRAGAKTTINIAPAIARTRANINRMSRWRGLVEEGIIAARAGASSSYEVVGTQIALRTGRTLASGRPEIRIIDTLLRHRTTGAFLNLESKTGGAVRSAIQKAKDRRLARGLGTFTGQRAAEAGLLGTPTGRILTWTVTRP